MGDATASKDESVWCISQTPAEGSSCRWVELRGQVGSGDWIRYLGSTAEMRWHQITRATLLNDPHATLTTTPIKRDPPPRGSRGPVLMPPPACLCSHSMLPPQQRLRSRFGIPRAL